MRNVDTLVIGAGLSGATLAERLAARGENVLVVEARREVAGNCYDELDENGIRVHRYGPHLFHTDSAEVWSYLSKFTEWTPYMHRVRAEIDGAHVPLPFSFATLEQVFPAAMAARLEEKLLEKYPYNAKVPILELKQSEDGEIQQLADFVYEKIFLHYTEKQWGKKPEEIAGAVTARVPVLIGRDTRYFKDRFQAVPRDGYTALVKKMLASENIHLLLGTRAQDVLSLTEDGGAELFGKTFAGKIIYTGMVDELFDFSCGELPYRSVRMAFRTEATENFQDAPTVNYPNSYDFTRITEFRKIHPAKSDATTLLYEYPQTYERGKNTAYYPIFTESAQAAYEKYADLAKKYPHLHLVGRLAEYRYYDMDDAVARALAIAQEI